MYTAVGVPSQVQNLGLSYYTENDLRLEWTPPSNLTQMVDIFYIVNITNLTSGKIQVSTIE